AWRNGQPVSAVGGGFSAGGALTIDSWSIIRRGAGPFARRFPMEGSKQNAPTFPNGRPVRPVGDGLPDHAGAVRPPGAAAGGRSASVHPRAGTARPRSLGVPGTVGRRRPTHVHGVPRSTRTLTPHGCGPGLRFGS